MSATIAIEIPREVIHVTRMVPLDLKRELALHLFEQEKLSFGKARELAEMSGRTVGSGDSTAPGTALCRANWCVNVTFDRIVITAQLELG